MLFGFGKFNGLCFRRNKCYVGVTGLIFPTTRATKEGSGEKAQEELMLRIVRVTITADRGGDAGVDEGHDGKDDLNLDGDDVDDDKDGGDDDGGGCGGDDYADDDDEDERGDATADLDA